MGEAVGDKDYPLLQTLMLLTTVGVLLANLIADLLYGVLDPRARRSESMTTTPASDPMRVGDVDQGQATAAAEEVSDAQAPDAWWQIIWSSKKARVGIVIVAVYVLVAVFAPLIAPHDPADADFVAARRPERRELARDDDQRRRTSPRS